MATRPRLYSKRGCKVCKVRAKKCDETKPICSECKRLKFRCSWPETANTSQPVKKPLLPNIWQLYTTNWDRAKDTPASDTAFGRLFDVHLIISALKTSWDVVQQDFELDDQWKHIIAIDKYSRAPTLARRFANIWIMRCLAKVSSAKSSMLWLTWQYFSSSARGLPSNVDQMPGWLIPRYVKRLER